MTAPPGLGRASRIDTIGGLLSGGVAARANVLSIKSSPEYGFRGAFVLCLKSFNSGINSWASS